LPHFGTVRSGREAIDNVSDGDRVIVEDGIYPENIDFGGKAILVRSANGPANAEIVGTLLGTSVVTFANGEGPDSVLKGFTVRSGSALEGGAIYCDGASPRILECLFTANEAIDDGGAIYCYSASPTIRRCDFRANTALGGSGGAIYCRDCTDVNITDCDISENEAAGTSGGGIYIRSCVSVAIVGCTVGANFAREKGGGIFGWDSAVTVRDCRVMGNAVDINVIGVYGGGLYFSDCTVHVADCNVRGNLSGGGGGIFCYNQTDATIVRCRFVNNTASTGGGVLFSSCYDAGLVRDYTIRGNVVDGIGGGVHFTSSSPHIVNTLIAENSADFYGGGINISGWSPEFSNCTISGNTAGVDGGGLRCEGGYQDALPVFRNCILWNDTPNEVSLYNNWLAIADPQFLYCDVQGGYAGPNNIDADPEFVDPANGDYHLQDTSPCIGVGMSAHTCPHDIEGNPRPSPALTNPDLGAYETPN